VRGVDEFQEGQEADFFEYEDFGSCASADLYGFDVTGNQLIFEN